MNDEAWLVLKACAKLLSGSWSDRDQLYNFLEMCSQLPDDSSLKNLIVHKLYLGVYTVNDRPGIRFALTRYLSYEKCSTKKFAQWWRALPKTAATAFVKHVFTVAFEAIEKEFYHWDIRPANNEDEIRFYILDWDSLLKVMDDEMRHPHAAIALKSATSTSTVLYRLKAELSLCEHLLFECGVQMG